MNGIVLDMPDTEYHALKSLSSTGARLLLESPAKFHYAQSHPQAHKDAFDLGTALHSKVLGVGAGVIGYPAEHLTPSGSVSTKASTVEWVAEQRAKGLIVISPSQIATVDGMAEAVLAHPTAKALLEQGGNAEASVFATDPLTGVELRARFDYLAPIAADVKSTAKSASPAEFERTVSNFGYDVQQEHYKDVHELATGERPDFVFIVVETDPPHLVAVHQIDALWVQMGQQKARRARELFAECSLTDTWPGYSTDVQLISPPTWAVYQHEEKYA